VLAGKDGSENWVEMSGCGMVDRNVVNTAD